MSDFRFQPTPFSSEWAFRLEAAQLTCHKGDARQWSVRLSDIKRTAFVSYKSRGRMLWRLDLITADQTLHISTNLPTKDAYLDDNFTAFHGLATALATVLDALNPNMQVGVGEHGAARKAMFGIGIVSALGGAGLFVAALFTGVSSTKMAGAAVPLLGLTVLGGMLIRSNHPWKAPTTVALTLLPQVLTYLAGSTPSEHG
ncbi:hypothetical protein [Shimia sp.]|uniref:hypothetical protein n=1 Tax=Shimia sp. TaxID=1954381 RepID=UPI00329714FB